MEKVGTTIFDTSNFNERVSELLKERIINLTYPPGQKLNPRAIAKELGISLTPVKDALIMLAGQGWVEISSRRGTYVAELSYRAVAEIMDVLLLLEMAVVETVGKQITAEQMEKLQRSYEEIPMGAHMHFDYTEFTVKVNEFHREIIRLAGNKTLVSVFDQLNKHNHMLRYRFARKVWERPPGYQKNYEEIMRALRKRDPEKAKRAISDHFLSMKKFFLERVAGTDA